MVFRSPKYYAELRKFRREQERKLQATSKPQAPSSLNNEPQASSPKQKGSSFKPQASSAKIPEPGNN
jgi:hypothetical protein